MSSAKRKGEGTIRKETGFPSKRQRTDDRTSSSKRDSKLHDPTSKKNIKHKVSSAETTFLVNSVEAPAFPRGGGVELALAERKWIRAQADQDALFEQNVGDGPSSDSDGLSDDSNGSTHIHLQISGKTSKKVKKNHNQASNVREEDIKIESLTFKGLAIGSLILGQISSINSRDIGVSLPNNLTGYVPLTSISPQVTSKVEKLLQERQDGEGDGEVSDGNEDDDVDLKSYVKIGQYLRAYVTSTGVDGDRQEKHKKRIELSLYPELCNGGLGKSELIVNSMLQASVHSIEDHGLIMDLGIGNDSIRGFIPKTELDAGADLAQIRAGMVFLSLVISANSSHRTIKLSMDSGKIGNYQKHYITSAPNIDCFLPGTVVEILLSDIKSNALSGKVMGLLDVTADIVHSGARSTGTALTEMFSLGQRVKGRLVTTFPLAFPRKLAFSLLEHVLELRQTTCGQRGGTSEDRPLISQIIPDATISKIDEGKGLYLSLGKQESLGFAHISNLSDKKVDHLPASGGPYKLGSTHKVRLIGFSPLDNLFLVSLQNSVLSQTFIRAEDVQIGQVVKGKIQKLVVGELGLAALVVDIADAISGLVPRVHFSDAQLSHPEKKFREGLKVTARVLSVDPEKNRIRLTLKKSLVNSEADIWKNLADIKQGQSAPGTLVKVQPQGAVVQFYGQVRGYLPVSEMSEAFIKDATQHFRQGQVVTVNAIRIDAEAQRMTLSCRDPMLMSSEESLRNLKIGTIVSGTVFEKSDDDLLLRLEESGIIARLALDHVADGSEKRRRSALTNIRVGQKLHGLLVLEVLENRRIVVLSNKASLLQAATDGQLLTSYSDLLVGKKVTGFITNITSDGIFVGFAGGIIGLLPKNQMPTAEAAYSSFGKTPLQCLTLYVWSIDYKRAVPRFWLSTREVQAQAKSSTSIINEPIDPAITSLEDLCVGTVTKARIVSVKDTQLNVELAKDIQGRIDVSEVFDDWSDIKDRKKPLKMFESKKILPVRILGAHDARNHRFLPITHRGSRAPVFELSAKSSFVNSDRLEILSLDKIHVGSSWIAYVNNIAENYLWANLSPNVRGRIAAMDVSDNLSLLSDLENNFPIGSALKVRVTGIDLEKNRLDLSAKSGTTSGQITLRDISKGMILPGRVTKASERQVLVQLSETIVGAVNLIDLADDFQRADPSTYHKNDMVRVCVMSVDISNKKIFLSLRPSKVLSSSLAVKDPEIESFDQLKLNEVRRGFITNISEKGVFVALGQNVTAFVRVPNLSDKFIKDWQEQFQRDQLVKGKIIALDPQTSRVQMSLKESVMSPGYRPPLTFNELQVGQIISGKIAKVEDYGVFILVDSSANIRGLCHRSEIADQKVEEVRKIFKEGDLVKAKVLKLEADTRRVNFGLKASYFSQAIADNTESDNDASDDEAGGLQLGQHGLDDFDDEVDIDLEDVGAASDAGADSDLSMSQIDATSTSSASEADVDATASAKRSNAGLDIGGFDWVGVKRTITASDTNLPGSESEAMGIRSKKRRKSEILVDRTGDLDANGPQSADDFERLLLGQPDSSLLWLQYMAFHLDLGEIDQGRQIAARAIQTIGIGQDEEKLNIWVAMLNLENAYGDDEMIAETFQRACEYNDPADVHGRLASIYIQSGKLTKADELFQVMVKKFSQDPKVWINYATFLFDSQGDADRGRLLLSRALQTLPKHSHIDITSKFAALEFRSPSGDAERGRTIFEGLLDSFPKRVDLWNVLLDLEIKAANKEQIRNLFQRIVSAKLKNKQAKFFFKRWLEFEEKEGDERSVDQVKSKAAEFVRQAASG